MEVNVDKIKNEIEKYNRLLDDYEDLYLQQYFELNYSSSFWNDGNSFNFYDKVKKDKNKLSYFFTELRELKSIYEYIIESYENVGNKISIDLKRKNNILNKIDKYIMSINKIRKLYDELDCEGMQEEKIIIDNHKEILKKINNKMLEIRDNVKELFERFDDVEKNIHYKLSKISVEKLNIQDINDYLR